MRSAVPSIIALDDPSQPIDMKVVNHDPLTLKASLIESNGRANSLV
jgi:hypothetical protein